MILTMRGHVVAFPRRPLVMGIVNITDDSFSGDGSLELERAIATAQRHVIAGADIIDVGGESARTNRPEISEAKESARILPFVNRFRECHDGKKPIDEMQIFPPLLSINTWRPGVAEATLRVGGHLLNDLSALPTDQNARIAANYGTGLLIMHSIGLPKQRHTDIRYADVLRTLESFFDQKIKESIAAGLVREAIVLDPGIDFAKQKPDNLRIYRELKSLQQFERPILLPVSRKTVIGDVLGIADPADRDAGTIACVVAGTLRGASIFRVHNVRAVVQALRVIYPIVGSPEE
ncbi:MAG TPA: dihydropteroate synthase [Chthoniobacterales bacterium]|jgi:dihydropteroate synthase|nr:dihydropteroate synthase [Chthoniobacterales bacterium]